MAQQQHDRSTKDFREPLLRVLGTKSGFKPGVEIAFETTYDPVCALVGCKRDQYGTQDASGIQWTERWTQWAFNDLVKAGDGKRAGRGRWALTQEGCDKARALCGAATVAAPTDDPVIPAPVPTAGADPKPVVEVESGVSVDVGPGRLDVGYSDDPYLRSLAAQATPCFGGFSPQSPLCATCPVQNGCTNALSAALSRTAATLAAEDKAAVAREQAAADAKARAEASRAAARAAAANPAAPAPAPTPSAAGGIPLKGTSRTIEMPVAAVCRHCGKDIPQGTRGVWAKDTGGSGQSAMLHLECFEALKGGTA